MLRRLQLSGHPDARIVGRVLDGEVEAFGQLVARHESSAYALACAHVGPSDAEDVVQEALLTAYRKLEALREWSRFRPWFLSIVRRRCADVQRHRVRDTDATRSLEPGITEPDVAQSELREVMLTHIAKLEPVSREVLFLHYYGGQSTRQIAADLDLSREAVKKRLQRARQALGRRLADDLDEVLGKPSGAEKRRVKALTALGLPASALSGTAHAGVATVAWVAMPTLVILTAIAIAFGVRDPQDATVNPVVLDAQAPPSSEPALFASAQADADGPLENPSGPVSDGADVVDDDAQIATRDAGPALGSIFGRTHLRGGDGEIIQNARVVLERIDWQPHLAPPADPFLRETTSDSTGEFFFSNLPLGDYVLRAYSEDKFDIRPIEISSPGFAKSSYLSLRPSHAVSGFVTDEAGTPIEGAVVYTYRNVGETVEQYLTARSSGRVVTDAGGRFTFSHIWPGRTQFYVVAPGYATLISEPVKTGSDSVHWKLRVGKTAGVRIVDAQGEPLANVRVGLAAEDARRDWHASVTAADGLAFFTNLRDTSYRVSIPGGEWSLKDGVMLLDVSAGDDATTLTAVEGARQDGRIYLEAEALGLADVRVIAEPSSQDGYWPVETYTDSEGRFSLTGLAETEYRVIVRSPHGEAPVNAETNLTIAPRFGQESSLEIPFERTVTLAGRVADAAGHGVEGANVRVFCGTYSEELRPVVRSERNGTFSVAGLRDETPFYAYAYTNDRITPVYRGTLGSKESQALRMTIDTPGTVGGIVVDEAGNVAPNVRVSASPKEYIEIGMVGQIAAISGNDARADASGRFRITGLPPGRYRINVCDPDDNSFRISNIGEFQLEAGEVRDDFEVIWTPAVPATATWTISGRVTTPAGEPVNRALIWASPAGVRNSMPLTARTDASGHFTVGNLEKREYSLRAEHDGFSDSRTHRIAAGSSGALLSLREMGEVTLSVVDSRTRQPVRRFSIGVSPYAFGNTDAASRAYIRREGMQTVVNDDGAWSKTMKAGRPRVLIEADGYAPYLDQFDVTPANEGQTTVTAALIPESRINLFVTDSQGQSVAGAEVFVDNYSRDPHPSLRHLYLPVGQTDSDGQVKIGSLTEGEHTLYVEHDGYALAWHDVSLLRGGEHDERVVLDSAGEVSGKVTMDGLPVSNGWVSVYYGDRYDWGRRFSARADDAGAFRIQNLPMGPAVLVAQWRDANDNYFLRNEEFSVVVGPGTSDDLQIAMESGTGSFEGTFLVNGERDMNNMYLLVHYANRNTTYSMSAHHETGLLRAHSMPSGLAEVEARFTDPSTGEERIEFMHTEIHADETTRLDIDVTYP